MKRDLPLYLVLSMILVAATLLLFGCDDVPPILVTNDVDTTIEVIDTVWIIQNFGDGAGVCAVCVDDSVVALTTISSFDLCAALAFENAGRVCAYTEYWKE